jgi:hypothetical protein
MATMTDTPINPDNPPTQLNEVDELNLEASGVWLVHAIHSTDCLDLDQKTAQRTPGQDAVRYDRGAQVLKLRSITNCASPTRPTISCSRSHGQRRLPSSASSGR